MSSHSEGGRRVRTLDLIEMKRKGERIAMLTAYDHLFGRILDRAGVDVVLVGDSLAEVALGYESTLPLTLEEIMHHARAVTRAVKHALVVVDLPFLSYQVSIEQAVQNAGRVMKETGAAAVKLEGGSETSARTVQAIVGAGIPVMGHLGFTPQSVHALGGAKVQGRGEGAGERLLREALRLQQAGAFSLVLELVPGAVASEVTAAIEIPTIGIGAGAGCDGQVLVLPDMLGLNTGFKPRFLRHFADLGEQASAGVEAYVAAVKGGEYPAAEHTFT